MRFDHWSGHVSGTSNPASITVSADKTVVAHFRGEYSLHLPLIVKGP
jgi:hypothetical protein